MLFFSVHMYLIHIYENINNWNVMHMLYILYLDINFGYINNIIYTSFRYGYK